VKLSPARATEHYENCPFEKPKGRSFDRP